MNSIRNTILQGDCIHVMQRLSSGSVDLILTDPPYLAAQLGAHKSPRHLFLGHRATDAGRLQALATSSSNSAPHDVHIPFGLSVPAGTDFVLPRVTLESPRV